MRSFRRILIAAAIGTLPASPIQAEEHEIHAHPTRPDARSVRYAQADLPEETQAPAGRTDSEATWAVPLPVRREPGTGAGRTEASRSTSYYKPARSYSTQPESDPPRYVRNLSETGIEAFKDITWLDVGLDHRTRYEFRSNDIRRNRSTLDQPFLLRSRAYFGIKEILDPLRGVVEFQDSRRYNGKFPHDDRDFNDYDLIQGYGELYFRQALGQDDRKQDRPLRVRIGRMAYEALDRRLIGRNEWRNTTNTFEGFRINLGQEANDWEIDLWAYQPVKRVLTEFDQRITNQWFYGAIGHWRRWSDVITLQPYYMGLVQDGSKVPGQVDRVIHATALRGYGVVGGTGLDYDFNLIYQFGENGADRQDAHGYTLEAGYTFKHAWKPRISAFYGYASGDRNPGNRVSNRFERFFGFARPWSADDYIIFENVKAPKIKLEFQPAKNLRIDGGYNWYWLASSTDRFNNLLGGSSFNRDPTGRSGDFIGHSVDVRVRYQLTGHIGATLGYSHFTSGEFTRNRQIAALGSSPGSSNFFYAEVVISAFK